MGASARSVAASMVLLVVAALVSPLTHTHTNITPLLVRAITARTLSLAFDNRTATGPPPLCPLFSSFSCFFSLHAAGRTRCAILGGTEKGAFPCKPTAYDNTRNRPFAWPQTPGETYRCLLPNVPVALDKYGAVNKFVCTHGVKMFNNRCC